MPSKILYNFVKKHNITKLVFVSYFVAIVVILYFITTAIFAQKGLLELFSLKNQIDNKEITKQDLSNKMNIKKTMVDGMNLDSLDVDLLDEQARKALGYVGKNEVVIYQEEMEKK